MSFFVKKPIVIEARQVVLGFHDEIADWCGGKVCGTKLPIKDRVIKFHNKSTDSEDEAVLGDYIVRGVFGEFYPVRKDIFEATYEITQ